MVQSAMACKTFVCLRKACSFTACLITTSLITTCLITTAVARAEVTEVRYNLSTHFVDPKQSYYIDLLRLAMEKSQDQYGDYRLLPVEMDMPQGRTIKLVEQGKLDVV